MWPFERKVAGEPHLAFDHHKIYQELHGGSGTTSLSQGVGTWKSDIAAAFDEAHQLITDTMKKVEPVWQGQAAEAFTAGLSPMGQFVLDAKDVSNSVGDAAYDQIHHYTAARDNMAPPVKVTATDNALGRGFTHLMGGQTDAEVQEKKAMHAQDAAARLYFNYSSNTDTTTQSLASYPAAPQTTTVSVAPPAPVDNRVDYPGQHVTAVHGTSSTPVSHTHQTSVSPRPGDVTTIGNPQNPQQGWTGQPGVPVGGPSSIDDLTHKQATGTIPNPDPTISGTRPGGAGTSGTTGPGTGGNVVEGIYGVGPIGGYGGGGEEYGRSRGSWRGVGSGGGGVGGREGGGSLGRGGSAGLGEFEERPGVLGARGMAAAGKPGAAGMPGVMGGAAGQKGEEDQEHETKYLVATDEHWGDGERVAPPVIGEE